VPAANHDYDTIVIGSGIGGLTCGALLAMAGQRVLVLDKNPQLGGAMQTLYPDDDPNEVTTPEAHPDPTWTWNLGIQYLTFLTAKFGPVEFVEKFMLPLFSHPQIEWREVKEHGTDAYQVLRLPDFPEPNEYRLYSDRPKMLAELIRCFPSCEAGLREYFSWYEVLDEHLYKVMITKLLPRQPAKLFNPLITKELQPFMKKQFAATLDELFPGDSDSDEAARLKLLFKSYWNFLGLPPETNLFFWLVAQNIQFNGVVVPHGGSIKVVEGLAQYIRDHGGSTRTSCGVEGILLEGLFTKRAVGVRVEGGEEIRAAAVVSDAGLGKTRGLMPSGTLPQHLERAFAKRVAVPSNFNVRVGFDPELTAADMKRLGADRTTYRSVKEGSWLMDDDPSVDGWEPPDVMFLFPKLYCSDDDEPVAQTAELIVLTSLQKHLARYTDPADPGLDATYERVTATMLDEFGRWFPELREHVVHTQITSPQSLMVETRQGKGSIYGLDAYKILDLDILPRSGIPGLYLTGEDVLFHGITTSNGILAAGAVIPDLALPFAAKAAATAALWTPRLLLLRVLPADPNLEMPDEVRQELLS